MFQQDLSAHPQLFAFSYRDLVPEDSDVWLYVDLFSQLDLSEFSEDYSSQGGEAKAPEMMLRTIFYGLTHGIVSGNKLSDLCRYDNRFILLSGCRTTDPRTFHRFLVRHETRLKQLFTEIVRLAQKMGLVKLGRVAIDGSKFKATTSKHKAMSYGRMVKAIEQLNKELSELKKSLSEANKKEATNLSETLPEEIRRREKRLQKIQKAKVALEREKGVALKEKDQKSFNDHDALPLGGKGKEFKYGYNCQAVVDSENQIIVAAELHDNQNDAGAIGKLLDTMEENCKGKAEKALADSGYGSFDDIQSVESRQTEAFIALGKGEFSGEENYADQLKAGEKENEFSCPAEKLLPVKTKHRDGMTSLYLPDDFCAGCHFSEKCKVKARAKSRVKEPLKLHNREKHKKIQAHRQRMRSEKAKEIYKSRKAIVEPVFGNIKNKGMKILLKGRKKVSLWWKMSATAHNLEKIVKHLKAPPRVSASAGSDWPIISG